MIDPIRRDADKLAQTTYCREYPDGGLMLTVGQSEQLLEACNLAPGAQFAVTLQHSSKPSRSWALAPGAQFAVTLQRLQDKRWFTPEVQCDFTNVVASNWLAKAKGWR